MAYSNMYFNWSIFTPLYINDYYKTSNKYWQTQVISLTCTRLHQPTCLRILIIATLVIVVAYKVTPTVVQYLHELIKAFGCQRISSK